MKTMFDRDKLHILPLNKRKNNLGLSAVLEIGSNHDLANKDEWRNVAKYIIDAKRKKRSIILMMGGHVIRSGVQKYIIDLMENGFITHLATNGSGMIHDFELALIGATTESVAKYIKMGQFGLWKETGIINDLINDAFIENSSVGMGETIGKAIYNGYYPNKGFSIFAAAHRLNIPITVHVGIGYDIVHEHPNCNGAATGALSYNDFLKFAASVEKLQNGVVMNFGSAVMAPEVFLKTLSMARNIAIQRKKLINKFLAVVCDIYPLPDDYTKEPSKADSRYYFRPWKTMLVRTIVDGGKSTYIKGRHVETIPALWQAIKNETK